MKKDVERKLLEYLLDGHSASQRGFGDRNHTSRLAVYKRRLVQRGFPVQTDMMTYNGDTFAMYSI